MIESTCLHEKFSLKNIIKYFKYKINFNKNNPDYFWADGLLVFTGPQGSGKTLSAVNYVYNLMEMYPNCKLVSNLYLKDFPFDKKRVFEFRNDDDFKKYNNGNKGVIFLVDEIQLYLNSLESKNINLEVITQIAQQRKQRKHIVCTSQVFGRMAKPLREQFNSVILCTNHFGFIQVNKLIDRDSIPDDASAQDTIQGEVKDKFIYFHTPKYYERYDTSYVIEKNKFVDGKEIKLYD